MTAKHITTPKFTLVEFFGDRPKKKTTRQRIKEAQTRRAYKTKYEGREGRMLWVMEDMENEIFKYRYRNIDPTGETIPLDEVIAAIKLVIESYE